MERLRVIPILLLKGSGLYKTVKFNNPKYIGDPINAVKIFNDKEVDELCFLDITATLEKREPNFKVISEIASECFMPLSYGGGIRTMEHAQQLFKIGVEKVIINSGSYHDPNLIKTITTHFGNQSVIGCMDVKKSFFGKTEVYISSGKKNTGKDPFVFAQELQQMGAGELMVNSIDRDGTLQGYDIELINRISEKVDIPVIACGGASGVNDIARVLKRGKASAAGAGSIFVFHGKHKAVLINYPKRQEILDALVNDK